MSSKSRIGRGSTLRTGSISRISPSSATRRVLAVCAALAAASTGFALAGTSAAHATTGGPGLSGVFISEVNTHGAGTNNDTVADGDWIELHNTDTNLSDPAVNLAGAIISDSGSSHELVIGTDFTTATTIAPGAYLAIRTDSNSNHGNANFGLGDVDEARLFANQTAFNNHTVADELDWSHSPVFTWAKNFTSGTWAASQGATLNAANNFTPGNTDPLSGVVINEVNMNGGANGDWIELYNTDPDPASDPNLTGAILSDNDDTHAYVIGAQAGDATDIPSGTWVAYQVDNSAVNGNFGLGGADSARLFAPGTNDLFGAGAATSVSTPPTDLFAGDPTLGPKTVDGLKWTTNPTASLGRSPDGNGQATAGTDNATAFVPTGTPTFAAANNALGSFTYVNLTGVVINEVKTTGDPDRGDWVELHNTTGSTVDLTDAILSDDNNSHIVRINSGVSLAANGSSGDTKVFIVDTDGGTKDTSNMTVVTNTTGSFGLGDNDAIRLYSADATALGPVGDTDNMGHNAPVDSFSWAGHNHVLTSYGRTHGTTANSDFYNGTTGDWSATIAPSPGVSDNVTGLTAPAASLRDIQLNEIDPVLGGSGDSVELINTSGSTLNVTGMVMSDNNDIAPPTVDHRITLNSSNTTVLNIPAGGVSVVDTGAADGVMGDNPFDLGGVDAIRLFEPGANVNTSIPIDHDEWKNFPPLIGGNDSDFQRQAAGLGDWMDCTPTTLGSANVDGTSPSVCNAL